MIKAYKKHHQQEPNSAPRLTEAAGIRLVWRAVIERKILVFSLLFLLVTLPILYLVMKYQSPIQAAWMDDSYKSHCAFSRRGTSGFFIEGNPHQKKSNNKKGGKNHYIGVYSPKFTHFSNSSSILTVKSKNIVANPKLNVKYKNSLIVLGVEIVIPAKAVIKAAAEKLINNPEKALSQDLEKNPVIKNNLTGKHLVVNV